MNQFKELYVVMITTNYKSKIYLDTEDNIVNKYDKPYSSLDYNISQHLYFLTSNEDINSGDWYMVSDFSHPEDIRQATKYLTPEERRHNGFKKILATTNSILSQTSRTELPQPSEAFIVEYIKAYNKGNKITKVLVEYEEEFQVEHFYTAQRKWVKEPMQFITSNEHWFQKQNGIRKNIKVDLDNTITIKGVKDSYNREEVIELFSKFQYEMAQQIIGNRGKDKLIPLD